MTIRNPGEEDAEGAEYIRTHGCWDCGSTIVGHHTPKCELTGSKDIKDLPEIPGTQWWAATRDGEGNYVMAQDRPKEIK